MREAEVKAFAVFKEHDRHVIAKGAMVPWTWGSRLASRGRLTKISVMTGRRGQHVSYVPGENMQWASKTALKSSAWPV